MALNEQQQLDWDTGAAAYLRADSWARGRAGMTYGDVDFVDADAVARWCRDVKPAEAVGEKA